MGTEVTVTNSGAVVSRAHLDGQAFQHQIELFRDSWLNGATEFGLDVELQALARPNYRAARRTAWDNGSGMTREILEDVYSKLTEARTLHVSPYLTDTADPGLHSRFGIGGRASTLTFNHFGVVTVTVTSKDGALMLWTYLDGNVQLRNLPNFDPSDGSLLGTGTVVAPYVEPDYIRYDDDPNFAEMLIGMGMKVVEEDGERFVQNPEAGLDWRKVLLESNSFNKRPKAFIADKVETLGSGRVEASYKGAPAHGTVKVLMGDTVFDHTTITGDKYFTAEAAPSAYAAHLQLRLWETPVNQINGNPMGISTTIVYPRDPKAKAKKTHLPVMLDVRNPETGLAETKDFYLDTRSLLGAEAHNFGLSREHVLHIEEGIPVDKHGTTMTVAVLRDDAPGLGTNWEQTSRNGRIATVYNNELYLVKDDASMYRRFGIPTSRKTSLKRRVFFIFHPPLADGREGQEQSGVFNDQSRANLKWHGEGTLDSSRYTEWAAEYLRNEPEWMKALKEPADTDVAASLDDPAFKKELIDLWNTVKGSFSPVSVFGSLTGKKGKTESEAKTPIFAVVEDDEGSESYSRVTESHKGTGEGEKRKPTETERAKAVIKGQADENGTLTGTTSTEKKVKIDHRKPTGPGPDKSVDLEPPTILVEAFTDEEASLMFSWRPSDDDPLVVHKAGEIRVNLDRAALVSKLTSVVEGSGAILVSDIPELGHGYLVRRIINAVEEYPKYEMPEVVDAVIATYAEFAQQQVMVILGWAKGRLGTKINMADAKAALEQPWTLTVGGLAQIEVDRKIRLRASKLTVKAIAS